MKHNNLKYHYFTKMCFYLILTLTPQFSLNNIQDIFTNIYEKHLWGGGKETVSGSGSMLRATKNIRKEIPILLKNFNIKSILDIPCGDFNWMKKIDLYEINYIGADIVPALIAKNNRLYKTKNKIFVHLDATKDKLPICDIILCRDCFLHIPIEKIIEAIINFKKSGAKYLLVNNYFKLDKNTDKETSGTWRPLNFLLEPFNFPKPISTIKKDVNRHLDNRLSLWKLEDINI